jgi:hypothetical protein
LGLKSPNFGVENRKILGSNPLTSELPLGELPGSSNGCQPEWLEGRTPVWPRVRLSPQLEQKLRNNSLAACYAHDVPFRAHSIATTITLAEPLAAQVWLGTSGNPTRRMVADLRSLLLWQSIATRTDSHPAKGRSQSKMRPTRSWFSDSPVL